MKIVEYVKSLLPSFDKREILENITFLQNDLSPTALQPFKDAGALFKSKGFQSKPAKDFNGLFQMRLKSMRGMDFVSAIYGILSDIPAKLQILEGIVHSGFTGDVTRDGMTYQKASVLKYLEVVQFAACYSRKLLLKTMASDTFQLNEVPGLIHSEMTQAESKWLQANQASFLEALGTLAMSTSEFKDQLESIPDITVIPDASANAAATIGASKLDPLKLGFIITTWMNPIYHFRMAYAEWQVENYKMITEEKKALEFRLQALREAYDKKQDPKLQQVITYTEGRISDHNRRLAQMQEDYA
jgi:hypothetical protein